MRKKFINLVGFAAVMAVILTGCSQSKSSDGVKAKAEKVSAENEKNKGNVYVESEFAPLKRVVMSQSEVYFPEDSGSNMMEDMNDIQIKMEKERNEFKKILQKYDVDIQMPRLLTEDEKKLGIAKNGITGGAGATNFFVRDPFFTIGDHIIEGSFLSTYRRLEVLPARDILLKEVKANKNPYVAVPQPDVSKGINSKNGPFLEGGDILVYGKTIFVGNSGQASNKEGIDWLRNYLTPDGYKVVEVKLEKNTLHLDCAISFVRDGLMIVNEDSLPNGIPDELKDWDKIKVSYKDAQDLAINGLPIDEKVYVTDSAYKNTIGKELEKRNIKVEYVDFKITRSYGGAFRCTTQPLLRK
ncbi:dimethylarginine dimethylaminohydrolase family protein [Bacillus altitudinis]|uniref:dimethylarginine dimethylaminohydrolase family protein n=1 Tax=Bacillus altitudinis TaxID=293387 RepID=UPI00191409E4|nr:arginine deiminase family protein [Bacillus altitudinis]